MAFVRVNSLSLLSDVFVFFVIFVGWPEVIDFGGLGGPGGSGEPFEWKGAKPPTFWEGRPTPPGRPDPKIEDFRPAQEPR